MNLSYDIFYNDNRDAEWVVLIHGFGGNRKMWKKQLALLKERFHVLNFDLPGHGESQNAPLAEDDLINSTVDAIHATMQERGIERAHFMGLCLGSVFTILTAIKYRESVIDMVLCGVIIGVNGFGSLLINAAHLVHKFIPYMWLYKLIAWIIMPKKQSRFSRKMFIRSAKRLGKKQFNFWFAAIMAAKKTYKVCTEYIANTPKLCIMGENDKLFLKMLQKEKCEEFGFQIKTIADCGHLCNIEKANEFNTVALSFLQNRLQMAEA